jgi:hypothetical protein
VTVVPGAHPVAPARPAAALAFCPSAPLLHPEVEGGASAETSALRHACDDAVAAMLAVAPEVVVVVADGAPPGVRLGPGDVGDLRGFGVDVAIPFSGQVRPGGRRIPPAHALGAWLLDRAAFAGERVGVGPGDVGQLLRALPGPVGVLVMGDGSARRTVKAPGYLDETAAPFDAAVTRALASGNAATLAALDSADGERLLAAGVPAWRAVGEALAGRAVTARLHLAEAPFGVGYLVADWVVA